jgi:predicted TPR repeat methyltransferase
MTLPIETLLGNVVPLDQPGLYTVETVETNPIAEANDRIGGVRINERKAEVFSSTYFQHRQYDRYIEALLRDGGFTTALDVGCGDGRGLDWCLAHGVEHSIGIDISRPALQRYACKGLAEGVRLVHAGTLDLDYRPEAFDFIMAIESLYYLGPRYEEAVARLSQTHKPGGLLACSLPDPEA